MSRRILIGSTILLAIAAFAIVCHNFKYIFLTDRSQSITSHEILFPEQKFLLVGPIDINKATIEELEAIPRIGPSLARRINDFLRQKGPIQNIQELLEVKGIGRKILKNISAYIMVEENPAILKNSPPRTTLDLKKTDKVTHAR